jgi:hypothetical protein
VFAVGISDADGLFDINISYDGYGKYVKPRNGGVIFDEG